jgi:hypothetical protein
VTVASPHHHTLVANTVYEVDFGVNFGRIEVLNVDGAAEVYFRTDGIAPTVAGDGCQVLAATIGSVEVDDLTAGQASVVKLISAGTPKVSVRGL